MSRIEVEDQGVRALDIVDRCCPRMQLDGTNIHEIDKTLQVLLAALLYRATPREFIAMLAPPQPQPSTAT